MTTDDGQLELIQPAHEAQAYERLLTIHLERLRAWTALPDQRTDWALENLLDELGTCARALRRLRGEADLPF